MPRLPPNSHLCEWNRGVQLVFNNEGKRCRILESDRGGQSTSKFTVIQSAVNAKLNFYKCNLNSHPTLPFQFSNLETLVSRH